jgi:uncharacterized Fe-S cluster-containing radical SAM superfamily protein
MEDSALRQYIRYPTPDSRPFDPLDLAERTERIVCRDDERKYTDFYATGVYGGIATGYACGCCLRCIFCWVDWSRDFPERYGEFYSPEQVFSNLTKAAHRKGVRKLRISGSEPTLAKKHLLTLLELAECSEFDLFILETNGILFGVDREYVRQVSKFGKTHVRVSLKAGTPESFTRKTGARAESFELPFDSIRNLMDYGVSFHVAAMSADPRVMDREERESLIGKLADIDGKFALNLEEEVVEPYKTTLARLQYANVKLKWPLTQIYPPIKVPEKGEFLRLRLGRYSHAE